MFLLECYILETKYSLLLFSVARADSRLGLACKYREQVLLVRLAQLYCQHEERSEYLEVHAPGYIKNINISNTKTHRPHERSLMSLPFEFQP
jgi:hypothetical protein